MDERSADKRTLEGQMPELLDHATAMDIAESKICMASIFQRVPEYFQDENKMLRPL